MKIEVRAQARAATMRLFLSKIHLTGRLSARKDHEWKGVAVAPPWLAVPATLLLHMRHLADRWLPRSENNQSSIIGAILKSRTRTRTTLPVLLESRLRRRPRNLLQTYLIRLGNAAVAHDRMTVDRIDPCTSLSGAHTLFSTLQCSPQGSPRFFLF